MIILQDNADANDVLGTRLLGPPTTIGLVKVNVQIRLWFLKFRLNIDRTSQSPLYKTYGVSFKEKF